MRGRKIKFDYIKLNNQKADFETFLASLPEKDQVKLLAVIRKTCDCGLLIAHKMKWIKKLSNNLYELRSKVSTNIQRAIYFHVEENFYLITHGFTKKTQKTPRTEIERAEQIRKKYFDDLREEKVR